MADVPVIVISSSNEQTGKTTLALNLAAALWNDGYTVYLLAKNRQIADFLQVRQAAEYKLPMPVMINEISEVLADENAKQVIIADVPTEDNEKYAEVFSQTHTLITMVTKPEDVEWLPENRYINLIWNTKKNIAARGIKYLNWIVVINKCNPEQPDFSDAVEKQAKRYGFRIAAPLKFRPSYQYISQGYCAADTANKHSGLTMTMADMYARREILCLTDFLWQRK